MPSGITIVARTPARRAAQATARPWLPELVVTTPGPVVRPEDLPPQVVATREEPFSLSFDLSRPLQEITDELVAQAERVYLRRILEKYRGRIDACAAHSGLSR